MCCGGMGLLLCYMHPVSQTTAEKPYIHFAEIPVKKDSGCCMASTS
jgi:hypothetical protein